MRCIKPASLFFFLAASLAGQFNGGGPFNNGFSSSPPPSSGFTSKRTITVDRTKVPNTDQTNFPQLTCFNGGAGTNCDGALGTLAALDLRVTGSGGSVTDAQADDVVFTTDSTCLTYTSLQWQVERYTGTTGELIAWVRIPTLTTASDYSFTMCYGNATITTFQGNNAGTWNANYLFVTHLPDGSSLTSPVPDSTSNAYDGTITGGVTATTGKIAGGAAFNGSTGYVTMGGLVTTASAPITMSAWINPSSSAAGTFMGNQTTDWPYFYKHSDDTIRCGIAIANNPSITSTTVATSAWTLVTCTQTSGSAPKIYFNGVEQAYSQVGGGGAQAGATGFRLGAYTGAILLWTGSIDEARISDVVQSADWILTEYNNQNSPSTFYAVGAASAP